jgi:hypothetical protein
MAEYRSHDIGDIRGHHSGQIAEILGKYHGPSVVSRKLSVWERDLSNIAPEESPTQHPGANQLPIIEAEQVDIQDK